MNRRTALRLVGGASITAVLGGCDERGSGPATDGKPSSEIDVVSKSLSGSPPPASQVHELLERLRLSYEAKGHHVSGALRAPIAAAELRDQCAWFPAELPAEIEALYGWRGGQDLGAGSDAAPFWFRDVVFSTPDQAKLEYASMVATYGNIVSASELGVDLKFCFPFAAFSGGWYVFPCRAQSLRPDHSRPVVSVFQGIDVYYYSLVSLLETCIAWVEHPDYGTGSLSWEDTEMSIWESHNPGVFSR